MNYEFLKKCVNSSAVTPMSIDWWDSILDHIPQHLVTSAMMEPHIQSLHDEVLVDYEKSIKKSMGMLYFTFHHFNIFWVFMLSYFTE